MSSVKHVKSTHPPKLIEKFLDWSLPTELKEPVLGDLAEKYILLISSQPFKARYWYTCQALRTGSQFLTRTKRGLIMFILGTAVFLGVLVMAMILSGNLSMFANLPSLLIVIPPSLLITISSTSKPSRINAFAILFSENLSLDKIQLNEAKHVITTFGNMSILMGIIGMNIGAIAMSSNIEPRVFSSVFGSAFAVCLLPLFYALLTKALCYSAEAKIQFKIIQQGS